MADILNVIDKKTLEVADFKEDTSDLILDIPLSSGQTIQFTAETQFFTPRQIATSKSDILGLNENETVTYTANNVPVVKMPYGVKDITSPQYYPVSVVSDVYVDIPIDNFFRELTDDLELPEDDVGLQTLRSQRDAAMQAAMSLDDLAAAVDAADPEAIAESNQEIDEGLASAIIEPEPDPDTILTPEEADELGALDLVGLTDSAGITDGADDIIDPTPEVLDEDLIQKLPLVPGNKKIDGIDKINQGITLLNAGIQGVEGSLQQGADEEGKCKFITVAKGKKGFLGVGKKKERKVSRQETETKLKLVREDIAAQEASPNTIISTKSGVPTLVKIQKQSFFGKAIDKLSSAGILGSIVGVLAAPFTGGASLALFAGGALVGGAAAAAAVVGSAVGAKFTIPKGYKPMSKVQALKVLNKTAEQLEKILAKDCE